MLVAIKRIAKRSPAWLAWIALSIVAIAFVIFTFWQDQMSDERANPQLRPQAALPSLRRRYLQHLVDSYQHLEFKGIIQFEKLPLRMSLEQVFVNLWAQPELPEGETLAEESRAQPGGHGRGRYGR